ncbi:MAG: serine/threonine protein kinase [Bifidobacteriaceae bacterium]|nr:serine/threonine protein kinase [Bifidobacteriaceae bacterium]
MTADKVKGVPLPDGSLSEPDDKIAGYQILSKIGSGLHGDVYLATLDGAQKVALKVLKIDSADVHAKERFKREIDALKRLNVKNIARVIDFEFSDGTVDAYASPTNSNVSAFIATEFIDGLTLDKYVEKYGVLDMETAISIFDALYNAVLNVHRRSILHRDIKPSNIIIESQTLKPYLIDFSIAKDINDVRLTKTGFVAGSPAYISPEALRGDEPSESDDFWGLTASLCYALTGRNPFGTKDVEQIIGRIFTLNPDLEGISLRDARTLRLALLPDANKRMQFYEVLNFLEVPDETEIINRETALIENEQYNFAQLQNSLDKSPTLVYNNFTNANQHNTSDDVLYKNPDEQAKAVGKQRNAFASTTSLIATITLAVTFVSFAVNMPAIAFIGLVAVYFVLNLLGRVANTRGFVLASVSVIAAVINTLLKIAISLGIAFVVSKIVDAIIAGQGAINNTVNTANNVASDAQIFPWLPDINAYVTEAFKIPAPLRDFFVTITLPLNEQNWINELALLILSISIALVFFTLFGAKYTFSGVKWIAKKSHIAKVIIIIASAIILLLDYYMLRTGLQIVYINQMPF